jgi:hypothetical protein
VTSYEIAERLGMTRARVEQVLAGALLHFAINWNRMYPGEAMPFDRAYLKAASRGRKREALATVVPRWTLGA